jgi:hypothetical protein
MKVSPLFFGKNCKPDRESSDRVGFQAGGPGVSIKPGRKPQDQEQQITIEPAKRATGTEPLAVASGLIDQSSQDDKIFSVWESYVEP